MAEYIDEYIRKNDVYNLKNAFISLIKEESTKHDGIEWVIYNRASESALNMIERGVQEIPAADVVEVVHARWVNINGTQAHYCNQCGMDFDLFAYCKDKFLYCPYCEEKMDLEEHHESNYL